MDARLAIKVWVVGILAVTLSGCALGPRPSNRRLNAPAPLKPGGKVDGATLTTGAAHSVSVWEVRRATIGTTHVCRLSAGTKLAVGPNTLAMLDGGGIANWNRLKWNLFLDDDPIDLPAFGTFDFVRYSKGHGQTEVARLYRAWDVMLTAPPGWHTLRGALEYDGDVGGALAKPGRSVNQWIVNIVLVSPD